MNPPLHVSGHGSMEELRRKLRLPARHEFHFSESSKRVRTAFFDAIPGERFSYHSFVVDKFKRALSAFRDPKTFCEFAVRIVCDNARDPMNNSRVVTDRSGNRDFVRQLAHTIKATVLSESGTPPVREVKMESSHSNNLVQPADMTSLRNADHEGHSSVRRAIQFDGTRDHLRSNLRDNQRFQTDAGHRAAPFGRGRMAPFSRQKIPERRQQKRAEAAQRRIDVAQRIFFQEVREKALRQILRVLHGASLPSYVSIERTPVSGAEGRHRRFAARP